MLQLSKSLINRNVMSLRNGHQVAQTVGAIINPTNLKIEGFYCRDSMDRKKELILLYQDIRDVIPQGFVIDDHDVLAEPGDLIRLQDILSLNFELLGLPVFADSGEKIGKINDFATEVSTFYIQKLYVAQSLLHSFGSGALSVDRSQIIEITPKKVVIKNPLQPTKSTIGAPAIAG